MKLPQDYLFQEVKVHHRDMGGWVRFYTDEKPADVPDLHNYLSYALTNWFRERPQLGLCCVLPVNRDGNTVELHAWYTLHVFAAPLERQREPNPI
jgi:hypothetical protein